MTPSRRRKTAAVDSYWTNPTFAKMAQLVGLAHDVDIRELPDREPKTTVGVPVVLPRFETLETIRRMRNHV